MLQVKRGVRSEEVRAGAQHVLFVEGSEGGSLDQAVLRALLHGELRIETMGPSFSVKSVAQALAVHHPRYYFLIDRDHHDDAYVERCWENFPDPGTDNLLVWRRREIENYFLDPLFLLESEYCESTQERLTENLMEIAQERLFLDVVNYVISSVREEQKSTWIRHFSNPADFASKEEAVQRLTSLGEFAVRSKAVSTMLSESMLRERFEAGLELMAGDGEELIYGRGRWVEMVRGKKILAKMVNSNDFEVRDAEGRRVTGKEKAYEILRDLAVKDVPSRPSDLVELQRLIHRRVRGAD